MSCLISRTFISIWLGNYSLLLHPGTYMSQWPQFYINENIVHNFHTHSTLPDPALCLGTALSVIVGSRNEAGPYRRMFSTLSGHRSVLAKQIKQALSLTGKLTEKQSCTFHQTISQMCVRGTAPTYSANEDTWIFHCSFDMHLMVTLNLVHTKECTFSVI